MYLRNILIKIIWGVVLVFIFSYAGYKLYPLISGPKIEISTPIKGDIVDGNIIKIKGRVLRAKEIKIFDREINVDPSGYFEESIVKQDTFTNIAITASDKYGRTVTEKYFVQ